MKRRQSTADSTALVAQKHGGALLASPSGGARVGAGRPPSYIREVARQAFVERIPILERIADSDESADKDRIAAIKVLADTGGVDKLALTAEEMPEDPGMTPGRLADAWSRVELARSIRDLEKLLTNGASHARPATE